MKGRWIRLVTDASAVNKSHKLDMTMESLKVAIGLTGSPTGLDLEELGCTIWSRRLQ